MLNACKGIQRVQHGEHMAVLDAVIDAQAVFAVFNQPDLTQEHELLRDIRLAVAQERRQMANALLILAQRIEDAPTDGVSNRFQ